MRPGPDPTRRRPDPAGVDPAGTDPAGTGPAGSDPAGVGPVLVVPGRGRLPVDTPVLRADDRGVLHGDGVFEAIHVRDGQPWLLTEHLDRLARSAARLDLAVPDRATLADLAGQACEDWPPAVEGRLRLVCTRGPAGAGTGGALATGAATSDATGDVTVDSATGGAPADGATDPPTVYALLAPVDERTRRVRRTGVRVATAPLGVTATARAESPWLLGGVKSLSYAANLAGLRHAAARRLDDLLWVSTDGYALEAVTSNLVWLVGDELCTVPAERTGVLAGTTARRLLDRADELGWRATERMVTPADLHAAAGVWLTSSIRGAVPVRELDGAPLPSGPATRRVQRLLGHPV